MFRPKPVDGYPGEVPVLLTRAFELAEATGLSLKELAAEVSVTLPRLRLLLGQQEQDTPGLHPHHMANPRKVYIADSLSPKMSANPISTIGSSWWRSRSSSTFSYT